MEVSRSSYYYKPVGISAFNLELLKLLDERHIEHPELGVPSLCQWLCQDKGYKVNKKRIERLCRLGNIHAIGPRPNTSKPNKAHKVYPYLLRNLIIDHSNQVWEMDITYIPLEKGFMYLIAIIDVYSRHIIGWELSNSMEAGICCKVVKDAVETYGKPEILNTDQGSQFTSDIFTDLIINKLEVKLSMDGRGRVLDNIYIERFWRTVKYDYVFLNPASDGLELYNGLKEWLEYYNTERRHKSLEYQTPRYVYFSARPPSLPLQGAA